MAGDDSPSTHVVVEDDEESGVGDDASPRTVTPGVEDDGIEISPGQRMAINATYEGIEDKTYYEMLRQRDRRLEAQAHESDKAYEPMATRNWLQD